MVKKIIFIFVCLVILNGTLISANIPTPVYGRVINESGEGLGNIYVKVYWTDYSEINKEIRAYTLNKSQAIEKGDENLEGYYILGKGEVDAKSNSYIIVYQNNKTSFIESDQGNLKRIPDLKINYSNEFLYYHSQNKSRNFFKSIFNFFLNEEKIGNRILKNESIVKDGEIGLTTAIDESVVTTFDLTPFFVTTERVEENNVIYGEWLNNDSDKNQNKLPPPTVDYEAPSIESNKEIFEDNIPSSNIDNPKRNSFWNFFGKNNSTSIDGKNNLKSTKRNYLITLIILIVIFLMLIILYRKKIINFFFHRLLKTKRDFSSISKLPASEIMNDDLIFLDGQSNIMSAIELFMDNYVGCILIGTRNNLLGVLSKKDLIFKIKDFSFDILQKTPIRNLMEVNYSTCSIDETLDSVYSSLIESGKNFIIVKNENDVVGKIDHFDFLEFLRDFKYDEKIPHLKTIVKDKGNLINSNDSMKKVKEIFLNKNTDYGIIQEGNSISGIVTIKDFIEAIYNSKYSDNHKIHQIMIHKVVSLNPGNLIMEAIDIVIEKRFENVPLTLNDTLVGVVSIKDLLTGYYNFLQQTEKNK